MTVLTNTKGHIMIVDDNEETQDVLSKILVEMGYEVTKASNGKEGLELFSQTPFNLVITDLMMPKVDGLTLAFSIKKRAPDTPIILITGQSLEAVQAGRVDFVLQKPLTLVAIEQTVQFLLRR